MAEIVNEAVIRVTADGSGVESGLRRVDESATRTGRNLENLGRQPGLRNVGEGADAAAGRVDRSTKSMADAIQRATSAMQAGSRGSAEYYRALANDRGLNANALRPYLEQLEAVTRQTEAAAEAQRQLDERTRFLADLRSRADSIGRTASELMQLRAAELGVSEAASPMIERLRQAERSATGFGAVIAKAKGWIGGLAVGAAVVGLGKQVVDAQREFDKLNASLVTATGSSERAAAAFKAIQSFAAKTPYDLKQTTEAFLQLRNLGLTPSERALTSFGNTAAAKSLELKDVVEAVADAATGEFERLKEAFGITSQQIGDNVAFTFQGTTTIVENEARAIEQYLTRIGEVQFGGAMERQADTLNGAIGQLGDSWQGLMRSLASNGSGDVARSGVTALSDALQDLGAIVDAVGGKASAGAAAAKEWDGVHQLLTGAFKGVAIAGVILVGAFKELGQEVAAIAAAGTKLVQGDLRGVKAVIEARRLDAETLSTWVGNKIRAISGASAAAAEAQNAETASVKQGGKDRLAQYAIELSADQKRVKAKQDIADIEKRLTGVDPQTTADLKKLSEALDAGAISQATYSKYASKIKDDALKNSEAYKDQAKQVDLSAAAIQRRAEVMAFANAQELEHLQFLQRTGQMSEEDFIGKSARVDVKALEDQKKALQDQLALAGRLVDNKEQRAALSGQIDMIERQIAARRTKEGNDQFELEDKLYRAAINHSADVIEKEMAERDSLIQQTQAQLDYNEQIGKTPKQIAAITAERLREAAARKEIEADIAEGFDLTGERADRIRAEAKALRERADAIVGGAGRQAMFDKPIQDAAALVDIMSALDAATQSAAQGMADSFGRVGSAIGGLTTTLSGYGRTQAAIAAQLAAATKDAGGDQTKIQRANMMAAEASAQAQIKSYGDMAGAAKDFFSENSAGYRVLGGIEKAYRAAEMAMALESMAKKIFFKETEVAANTALNATKLTGEAATTAASTGLAATEASAWGITAVVKAIASMPFPLNLAAGAATLAAVVAVGAKMIGGIGGGSVSLSEQRQKTQGTGTVLGSSGAKSESISRAIELSASNSSTQINYLSGMLTSLRAIEYGIGSFASQLVQTSGITGEMAPTDRGSAANFFSSTAGVALTGGFIGLALDKLTGGWVGKITGSIANKLFGGKTTVEDTGFTMSAATLAAIQSQGAVASQYADIKKDGGLFRSDKRSTQLTSLGVDANAQFSLIIESMADAIGEAGDLLGVSGAGFETRLNSFVVDIGKVSLKGMTGEEIQKELESVFSRLSDQMAQFAIGGLNQFQKVGEGYMETLARVATDYAKIDASMQSIGRTFGMTGMQSIAAREALVELMGGIDELQSQTSTFAQNFLSQAEQLAPVQTYVTQQLAALNLGWVDTREEFKQVVLGLDLTTASGQQTYASLMSLAEAFAATHAAVEDLTKTEQQILDERVDLQDQLDQLTMTSTQLLKKQRDALAEANRPLFDMIQAAQALADTSSGLTSFRDSLRSLSDSLVTGSLSTLTPEQQYAELRSQYEKTRAAALGGDTQAQDDYSSVLTAFLTASQKINGGDSQYQADFAMGQQDAASMAAWATGQIDTAQQQLNAMANTNAALDTANKILDTIAQNTTPAVASGFVLNNAFSVLSAALKTLQASNDKLVEQVDGLRKDQQAQTGDTIAANDESQQSAAGTIVTGLASALVRAVTSNQKVVLE